MLLETLTDLVTRAAKIPLEYYQTSLAVETKSDLSPVTEADRRTEEFLRGEIARLAPGDAIMGEEYGRTGPADAARTWVIDPIDGTKSFVQGVPLFGIMVGVEDATGVLAGAIALPAMAETVVAERGRGCLWNGAKARVSATGDLARAVLLTTDARHARTFGRQRAWETLCERTRYTRTWGDCYGFVLVATGRAEIMFDPGLKKWDAAPLPVILEEAGGRFTNFAGEVSTEAGDYLATNGLLHDEVLRICAERD